MVFGEGAISEFSIAEVEGSTHIFDALTFSVEVEGDSPAHTDAYPWWTEYEYGK